MTTTPKEEMRLYHPNRRDCPNPVWRAQTGFRDNGVEYPVGYGSYECPGHKVTVEAAQRFIVKETR